MYSVSIDLNSFCFFLRYIDCFFLEMLSRYGDNGNPYLTPLLILASFLLSMFWSNVILYEFKILLFIIIFPFILSTYPKLVNKRSLSSSPFFFIITCRISWIFLKTNINNNSYCIANLTYNNVIDKKTSKINSIGKIFTCWKYKTGFYLLTIFYHIFFTPTYFDLYHRRMTKWLCKSFSRHC